MCRLAIMRPISLSLISVLTLFANNLAALNDESYAKGWYWGVDEKNTHEQPKEETLKPPVSNKTEPSNAQVLDAIKIEVEELKARAMLNPTAANVADYIKMQNKVVNMASRFSAGWQNALSANPELDYTATNPTNNYARQLIAASKKNDIEIAVQNFASQHGLIFFFKGNDVLSLFQSKIISAVVAKYNIAIIPVAINNIPNEYFPNPVIDNSRAQKLGITITPAIIAMNISNNQITPLLFGIATEHEIEEKIYDLMQKEIGYE